MHVMWLPHYKKQWNLMDLDLFKGDASIVAFTQLPTLLSYQSTQA